MPEVKIDLPTSLKAGNGLSPQQLQSHEDLVKKLESTRFADILASNPYLGYERKQTWMEGLIESLGFRSKYQKDIEQNAQAAREYDAQAMQLASEEKYNSPVEAAGRLRNAGMSPALAGLDQAGQASEFAQEQGSPDFSEGYSGMDLISGLCSSVMKVFSLASGFGESMLGMQQLSNAVESGQIDNASKMLDLANKAVMHATNGNRSYDNLHDREDDLDTALVGFKELFSRRGTVKRFNQSYQFAKSNLVNYADEYKKRADAGINRRTYLSGEASQYFNPNDRVMQAMLEPIVQLSEKVDKEKLDYDHAYYKKADPELRAEAENEGYATDKQSQALERQVNSTFAKIVSNLAKESESGNWLAGISLLLIQSLRGISGSFGLSPNKAGKMMPKIGLGF